MTSNLKLAIMESQHIGDEEANLAYARECMDRLLLNGYAPLYAPEKRRLVAEAGHAWRDHAECTVFCARRGWSSEMLESYAAVIAAGLSYLIIDGGAPVRW